MKFLSSILLSTLVAVPGTESADEKLKTFFESLAQVVQKHYPKAQVTAGEAELRFSFDARRFMIHEATKDGEWQDAFEEAGPRKGGIVGEATVRPGRWDGQAVVPQALDKRYFTLWIAAPYSAALDRHLLVRLKYPRQATPEFLKDFTDLVASFEKLGR